MPRSAVPGVAEAAAIGIYHPKWDERPLLLVVRKPGSDVTAAEITAHLAGQVAKWWLPDEIVFVDELPHTATGKILKTELRDAIQGSQAGQRRLNRPGADWSITAAAWMALRRCCTLAASSAGRAGIAFSEPANRWPVSQSWLSSTGHVRNGYRGAVVGLGAVRPVRRWGYPTPAVAASELGRDHRNLHDTGCVVAGDAAQHGRSG